MAIVKLFSHSFTHFECACVLWLFFLLLLSVNFFFISRHRQIIGNCDFWMKRYVMKGDWRRENFHRAMLIVDVGRGILSMLSSKMRRVCWIFFLIFTEPVYGSSKHTKPPSKDIELNREMMREELMTLHRQLKFMWTTIKDFNSIFMTIISSTSNLPSPSYYLTSRSLYN